MQLSILQCAGGISEGVACFRYNSTSATLPVETKSVAVSISARVGHLSTALTILRQIWIGGGVACDITITISMVYFVRVFHTSYLN